MITVWLLSTLHSPLTQSPHPQWWISSGPFSCRHYRRRPARLQSELMCLRPSLAHQWAINAGEEGGRWGPACHKLPASALLWCGWMALCHPTPQQPLTNDYCMRFNAGNLHIQYGDYGSLPNKGVKQADVKGWGGESRAPPNIDQNTRGHLMSF